jgi:hypothetical protein
VLYKRLADHHQLLMLPWNIEMVNVISQMIAVRKDTAPRAD